MRPYTELPSNTCYKLLQKKTLGKLPKMPSTQLRIKQRTATRNQGTKGQEPRNFIIGISLMGANLKSMVSSCRNRVLHKKEYLLLKLSSQEKNKKVNATLNTHTHTPRHVVWFLELVPPKWLLVNLKQYRPWRKEPPLEDTLRDIAHQR